MTGLEDRLTNWGRALRTHRAYGRAMSFEGGYRSPQRNHWTLPAVPILGRPDAQDAMIVERAWGSLPPLPKIVLRGHYCLLWTPKRCCRAAQTRLNVIFPTRYYDRELDKSKGMIAIALTRTQDQNANILRVWVRRTLDEIKGLAYSCD